MNFVFLSDDVQNKVCNVVQSVSSKIQGRVFAPTDDFSTLAVFH